MRPTGRHCLKELEEKGPAGLQTPLIPCDVKCYPTLSCHFIKLVIMIYLFLVFFTTLFVLLLSIRFCFETFRIYEFLQSSVLLASKIPSYKKNHKVMSISPDE